MDNKKKVAILDDFKVGVFPIFCGAKYDSVWYTFVRYIYNVYCYMMMQGDDTMTTAEYLVARKSKNWKFNTVVDRNSFAHVNRIHPIKQQLVKDIVAAAQKDEAVKKVIIFGSSIRYDCDVTSDLDICLDWIEDCYDSDGVLKPFTVNMRKMISIITKGRADVVNFGYLDGTVVENAVKEGIVVYEHNVQ